MDILTLIWLISALVIAAACSIRGFKGMERASDVGPWLMWAVISGFASLFAMLLYGPLVLKPLYHWLDAHLPATPANDLHGSTVWILVVGAGFALWALPLILPAWLANRGAAAVKHTSAAPPYGTGKAE